MGEPLYYIPGPCTVSWGGSDLGTTKNGITIRFQRQMIPIIDDEHGTEPADWIRAGVGAIVEAVFNDMAKFKAAITAITVNTTLLSDYVSTVTQVGKLIFDGNSANTQWGKELIISENGAIDNTKKWKAKYTMLSDPTQLLLSSTQENLVPLLFYIAMDENEKLFYNLPEYLT